MNKLNYEIIMGITINIGLWAIVLSFGSVVVVMLMNILHKLFS